MNKVGILHHPYHPESLPMARRLAEVCEKAGVSSWIASAWDEAAARAGFNGTTLLICVGGDGTMLRGAQLGLNSRTPILGVSMGRFGFLAELSEAEAVEKLPAVLRGEGWIEERAMLQAELVRAGQTAPTEVHHGLNEVTVSRAAPVRPVYVAVYVDGGYLATYRADGVIVATATGSTAYNLSAGGPILHPAARDIILNPIAPHMGLSNALVLPPDTNISLRVGTDNAAAMSVDGQLDLSLHSGDRVIVKRSPYLARFVRLQPPTYFYARLIGKLGYSAKVNNLSDGGDAADKADS